MDILEGLGHCFLLLPISINKTYHSYHVNIYNFKLDNDDDAKNHVYSYRACIQNQYRQYAVLNSRWQQRA